ncbi:MAG TPA: TetR family transcriptional regulator [Anaerolineaceae bacterium]|nr:TetR family transcriptional regulator [Anaerolineaceae bacterium]
MVIKQRAIRHDQKLERRQAILAAGRELFDQASYSEISMESVSKRANLAKGTLYLYFKTKEELFLALLEQELESWFDEMDAWLAGARETGLPPTLREFASILSQSLAQRSLAVRLIAISETILESNIDYPTALRYKLLLHSRMAVTGAALESLLPFLSPGAGVRLILWVYMLIIGVQSVAEPAPIVRRTLEEPGLRPLRVDFQTEIESILSALIAGLSSATTR